MRHRSLLPPRIEGGRHHRPLQRQEEDLLAIPAPARRPASVPRHDDAVPLPGRERSYVHFQPTRYLRMVGNPPSVGENTPPASLYGVCRKTAGSRSPVVDSVQRSSPVLPPTWVYTMNPRSCTSRVHARTPRRPGCRPFPGRFADSVRCTWADDVTRPMARRLDQPAPVGPGGHRRRPIAVHVTRRTMGGLPGRRCAEEDRVSRAGRSDSLYNQRYRMRSCPRLPRSAVDAGARRCRHAG